MIVLLLDSVIVTDFKLIIRHLIRFALTPDIHVQMYLKRIL